ncbi:MAG: tetratricopeptide repeat protein [Terriglobia bacterium]
MPSLASACHARYRIRVIKAPAMWLSKIAIFVVLAAIPAAAQSGDLAKKSHQASELMAAGKFDQAIPIYRELVRAIPNNPGFALNLGLALHMAGRDREAIPPLQTALKRDPQLFPANLFLGAAFLGAGEPERAIPPLTKACKTQPANPDAQQMLAAALLSLDRFKEAAEHYKKLSELLPQNPKAWAGVVQCYQALAQSEFEKLGRTARDSGYWFALMAEARAKNQQFKSAFYLYRQALGRTPELRGVHAAVAEIYRKSDHPDWAVLEDKKERELPAPNCTVREAECDFFAGRYAEAAMAAAPTDGPDAFYWRTKARRTTLWRTRLTPG